MAPDLIRAATPDDPVAQVIREAFGDEGDRNAALWAEVADSEHVRASLVAVVDGAVVGHVGLSHIWLDARRQLVDLWMLSPVSVLPGRQGAGIGTALVAAAVDAARAGGAPMLVLEGSPDYYGARGFEPALSYDVRPASDRTPAPAFQVAILDREEWMTGRAVYPDVWWRHDAAGLRDPWLAEVEKQLEEARG